MQGPVARLLALASLASVTLAPVSARTGDVVALRHAIELEITPEGATLHVTHTLFNASTTPAEFGQYLALPCDATIDEVAIEARAQSGKFRKRVAKLLDADDAAQRWDAWLEGPGENVKTAADADSALYVRRGDHWCHAELSIYPIPPMHTRTVWYRVFVPSNYAEGRYAIELPNLGIDDETATWTVTGEYDDAFSIELDGRPLSDLGPSFQLDHMPSISLQRHDAGVGAARVIDLDVARMIAQRPAAAARLEDDEVPGRLLAASFEAPRELATPPPVRRVVVVLDASHSLRAKQRQQLQQVAARYLEQLAKTTSVQAEVVLFDREIRQLYHDFMPAAWVAEDLRHLEVETKNGSEAHLALARARELLAQPSSSEGVDWIILLSDVYLRTNFPLADELDAAARSPMWMHVIRPGVGYFHPRGHDEAWSMIAREARGVYWNAGQSEFDLLAQELIGATYIWSLRLELALVDGSTVEVPLDQWLLREGESIEWLDAEFAGPALARATFVGEVWGQRREWVATSSDELARRTAGSLATADDHWLSAAVRTALADHAQVVSSFTSAWAVASFAGPAAPPPKWGYGGQGFRVPRTTSCGLRGFTSGPPGMATLGELTRDAISRCPDAEAGVLMFETTDLEVVDVLAPDACVRERIWGLDLTWTKLRGRRTAMVEYEGGNMLGEFSDVELGYRDVPMRSSRRSPGP